MTDRELDAFVVRDQREYRRPAVDTAHHWTRYVRVDMRLLTFARATVTLREGRLITKKEALERRPGPGAPVEVGEDVRRRRYADPVPPTAEWAARRSEMTRSCRGPAIDALVAAYG